MWAFSEIELWNEEIIKIGDKMNISSPTKLHSPKKSCNFLGHYLKEQKRSSSIKLIII